MLKFNILKKEKHSKARLGVIGLAHGDVETPVFMPVGTAGCVKALYHKTVSDIGYKLILANTYHLHLQPGEEVLDSFGGIHRFSSWNGNILTDSGGFQIFSLSSLRKIKDEGVTFHSHIDGSLHKFTPESVVRTQGIIGSDIAMCLDVCSDPKVSRKDAVRNMEVTHDWACRSIEEFGRLKKEGLKAPNNLFGIVQGAFCEDLREQSARFISSLPFDGIAIGGLSVGESHDDFIKYLAFTAQRVDNSRPLYVMGIGSPLYMLKAVENGIDMFDCVQPTRVARHGLLYTKDGVINITKAKYRNDSNPVSEECSCTLCRNYSRGYLRHLFKAGEGFAGTLASEHNLTFFNDFMKDIRKSIEDDRFLEFEKNFLDHFKTSPL